ncbi:gliding motility lipoprotein GldD [Seonamhaeicola sp. ML3]|uniref:gliding motility lipoprotein GldD n=1 Tax=Seonamhaeicola sp. ML3 TaxID=2937786 RepID=UPI00200F8F99|nr:gliding motility lipoprotein GldD [Seonamhaeicola sp. ML3]
MRRFQFILIVVLCVACGEDYKPKPKAFLNLQYPEAQYISVDIDVPFSFETNILANKVFTKQMNAATESYGINIEYPALKGTVFLTYKAVEDNEKNLEDFIRDAQKFTLEHTKKADEIPVTPYENTNKKVYGTLSEVKGNVASPLQFYVTDSVNHFLVGSLYFNARPNYDSILPAANYIKKDIVHLMESISWE